MTEELPLPAQLSQALVAFTIEFDNEDESGLSLSVYTAGRMSQLPICANILRVLDEDGVPARDLPALTGVAKMTIDNWLGILAKRGYAAVGPGPAGGRARLARLTPKGRRAQDTYLRWAAQAGQRWDARFGDAPMRALSEAVGELTGAPGPDQSPRWPGLEPYPGGWRAAVPRPQTLPHYPVISARGGFPDGN